ncbi:MAG TPA: GNAT family N-acetyltransferase [Anaerolineae bacterium]|nr:GNAT family N-acetyltransferase [Anaerolineae bacterium]
MLLRPAVPSDAGEWLRLRLALWPDSDPDEQASEIAYFFASPPRPPLPTLHAALVCQRPECGLCGLVEISIRATAPGCHTGRIGYLEAWYVDPDARRQGVGRALVAGAEAWARAAGCLEMASDTTPFYPLSPSAHAALGYQEVERYFRKALIESGGEMSATFPTSGMELTHILVVSDLDRARAFYRDVLGASLYGEYGGTSIVFNFNGAWLLVVTGGEPTQDKPGVVFAPPDDPNRVSHSMTIRVRNCQEAYDTLLARGAEFLTPPVHRGREIRAFFRDPDGHLFEISQVENVG